VRATVRPQYLSHQRHGISNGQRATDGDIRCSDTNEPPYVCDSYLTSGTESATGAAPDYVVLRTHENLHIRAGT
jgi:hypothetical protein